MDGVENSRMYVNGGCSSDQLNHFPSSSTSHLLESLWIQNPSSSINDPSMVNFHDYAGRSLPAPESNNEVGEGEDDVSSETEGMRNPYRRPEKKRRLSPEQVKKLERCFEVETKLEPERKVNIAKELSLQPRQVAIWFQNRRARFKTKQLEKEYDSLQANFESLKSDFDDLVKEKERLQTEVSVLTNKLKQKEKTGFAYPVQVEAEKEGVVAPPYKQEDASSAKSDVSDSESPQCNEGNYTSAIEEVTVKPEWSQLPPERSFRPVAEYGFGDVFEVHGSGCHLGLTGVEDQSNYWPWLY